MTTTDKQAACAPGQAPPAPLQAPPAPLQAPPLPLRRVLLQLLPLLVFSALLAVFLLLRRSPAAANLWIDAVTNPLKRTLSLLWNPIPFSGAELCWTVFVLWLLFVLLNTLRRLIFCPGRLKTLGRCALTLVTAGVGVYAGYSLLWGVNYYGDTLSQRTGLMARGVSAQELYQLTCALASRCSAESGLIPRTADGVFDLPVEDIFARSQTAYDWLEQEFPFLAAAPRRPKPMFYSRLMSQMGFTGFFFPFTGEANLNVDSPRALLPATVLHEMAHQRSVAAEQECNFAAIVGGLNCQDAAFRYSSALLGFLEVGNALYSADPELWQQAAAGLNGQVRADLAHHADYWAQFDSPAEDAAKAVYEGYLQANDQTLGMKSYGACVDLLAAYYFDWGRPMPDAAG